MVPVTVFVPGLSVSAFVCLFSASYEGELGSGLLFCRFSFPTDDVHQVIITHVVNDLLKFFVRSGTSCGGGAAAADVGDVRSGQFGDPPLEPVCA